MALERARAIFSGYVQGVGFRFTARMLASHFSVTGLVLNLPDGTVKLEAQGERSAVESYLGELRTKMSDYITRADVTWASPVEDEDGFSVRF